MAKAARGYGKIQGQTVRSSGVNKALGKLNAQSKRPRARIGKRTFPK